MTEKILLECIESCFCATVSLTEDKYKNLARTSALFDTLKLFIRISVQIHCLKEQTYLKLIPSLGDAGRMLGGWMQKAKTQNPIPNTKSYFKT